MFINHINVTDFTSLTDEVKKVILKWWQPKELDIVIHSICVEYNSPMAILDYKNDYNIFAANKEERIITVKDDLIPLFNEGQLRQFIEDKLNGHVDIAYYNTKNLKCVSEESKKGVNGYTIEILTDQLRTIEIYEDLGYDLLYAYWKVVVEIATKEANKKI